MITDSEHELFAEPKGSLAPKLLGAGLAVLITAGLFLGYTALRKRHQQNNAAQVIAGTPQTGEPKKPPKALVLVDDALLQGGKTIIGGTVRNTSPEKLGDVSVELELKRRKDGVGEKRLVALEPAHLEPQQEGRYSVQLKAQDYGSARLVALRVGPDSLPLPYATAQGQKRAPERLESKTVTVEKRSSKGGAFLNSPDNPAHVP
ncbi:MAG: hypothetical protein M3R69_10730 [Acidobacteriota bacterium]|nr:hypothetical protein [Acidobacteriota bacterium]